MDNRYLYMVAAGVMAVVSWYILELDILELGEPSESIWIYAVVIAVALGAGNTGGNDFVSILSEGLTGFIPTMIIMMVFSGVYSITYNLMIEAGPVDAIYAAKVAVVTGVTGIFTNVSVSYLKKAA